MSDDSNPRKGSGRAKSPQDNDRETRLKAALKANMAKRKAQAKARAGQGDRSGTPDRDKA